MYQQILKYNEFINRYDYCNMWKTIISAYSSDPKYIHCLNFKYLEFLKLFLEKDCDYDTICDFLVFCVIDKYENFLGEFHSQENDNLLLDASKEYFGYYLQDYYDSHTFDLKKIDYVGDIFLSMKKYSLKNLKFKSEKTTIFAREKINDLKTIIGGNPIAEIIKNKMDTISLGDNFYKNLAMIDLLKTNMYIEFIGKDVNNYLSSLHDDLWSYDINAYYDPLNNIIYIPTAMVDSVVYSIDKDHIENYGSIGCIIGHEMMHMFDLFGYKFRKGKVGNWLQKNELDEYCEIFTKLQNQYKATADYVPYNDPAFLSESFSDALGIKLSLKTYLEKYVKSESGGLDEPSDEHPPNNLRINVPFSHISEYYDTYNVKSTNRNYLSPSLRVSIFD